VAPAGITCAFNPTTVTPAGSAVATTLTATVASGTRPYGATKTMGMAFTGLGVFGCFFFAAGAGANRRRLFSLLLGGFASLLIAGTLLAATGCGSGSSSQMNLAPASVVVTAQSGALTQMTTISLTVQ
jgi:hypothetical protein